MSEVGAHDHWQPMDTAPRDGTWVLLAGGEVIEGRDWQVGDPVPPCVVAHWLVLPHLRGFWCFAYYDQGIPIEYAKPTRWRRAL